VHHVGCSLQAYIEMHGQKNIKKKILCVILAGPLSKVSSGRILHTYSEYGAYIDKKVYLYTM